MAAVTYNQFNPYYNNILLCSPDGTPNNTATILIQEAKKGLGEEKGWNGDENTVQTFLDYLYEKSKNYYWHMIRKITLATGIQRDLISIQELVTHIDTAYWKNIENGTSKAQERAYIQKKLHDELMFHNIKS